MTRLIAAPEVVPAGEPRGDLFGRIVSVYQSNEFLFSELETIKKNLASARAYLDSPGGNRLLARARIDRLKARRLAALTMLRANRLQARTLLACVAPDPGADAACA